MLYLFYLFVGMPFIAVIVAMITQSIELIKNKRQQKLDRAVVLNLANLNIGQQRFEVKE